MKEVKIITMTPIGRAALEGHLKESARMRWDQKQMFRLLGFSQNVISQDPFTVSLFLSNRRLSQQIQPDHFTGIIDAALESNGAKKDIDYKLELII